MTQTFRFSRFALLLLALALLAGTGCSRVKGMFKDKDANEGVPVEQLYEYCRMARRYCNWIRSSRRPLDPRAKADSEE